MQNTVLMTGGALLLVLALGFNLLVRRRNAVENAFAAVDVYLLMRYELVPNLVETVRGYARHEAEVLAKVTELRQQALQPGLASEPRVRLDNQLVPQLHGLLALAQSYPKLCASENFQHLQRSLNEIEERLSAARRSFNACVLDYNNAIDQLPLSLIAAPLGFRRRSFFAATDAAVAVPAAVPPDRA